MSKQDKKAEVEFFNEQAAQKEIFPEPLYQKELKRNTLSLALEHVAYLANIKRELRILEVGSNADFVSVVRKSHPKAKICSYIGDIAFNQLLFKGNCAHKINLDLETLPFKDGAFDIIYLRGVLHHFPSLDKCIGELMRTCRLSIIVTNEPCGDNPLILLSRFYSRIFSRFIKINTTPNETIHSSAVYRRSFCRSEVDKVIIKNGDSIFCNSSQLSSYLSHIKAHHRKTFYLFILVRCYLQRALIKLIPRSRLSWNSYFIFVGKHHNGEDI